MARAARIQVVQRAKPLRESLVFIELGRVSDMVRLCQDEAVRKIVKTGWRLRGRSARSTE
jgi:hypothetical protein